MDVRATTSRTPSPVAKDEVHEVLHRWAVPREPTGTRSVTVPTNPLTPGSRLPDVDLGGRSGTPPLTSVAVDLPRVSRTAVPRPPEEATGEKEHFETDGDGSTPPRREVATSVATASGRSHGLGRPGTVWLGVLPPPVPGEQRDEQDQSEAAEG